MTEKHYSKGREHVWVLDVRFVADERECVLASFTSRRQAGVASRPEAEGFIGFLLLKE